MANRFKLYVLIIIMNIVVISMSENTFTHDVDINTRCPYSDICGRNASLQLTGKSQIPCCSSCSCSPDCGLHMNCCYEHMDKYRLVESNQMNCVNIGTIYATRYETNAYYMIDKYLNHQNGGNHSSTQCRAQGGKQNKMASYLTPVSSVDSGFIYFNSECAKCNNVYEYTPWDYEIQCGIKFDISSPRLTLQYIIANDLCDRMFVAPKTEDWSARKCYTFEPNTCEIADKWLSDMCTSIYSPYINVYKNTIRMYRNIYCAMCNTHTTFREYCAAPGKTIRRSLVSIIKGSVNIKQLLSQLLMVNTTRIPKTDGGECLPHEVMHPFQNDCRYIYCPTGMYRTDNGCDYYIARLLTSFYMVQIELTPYHDTKLMTSSLKLLSLKDRKNPKRWIRSPCIDDLFALEVFYRVVNDSDTSGIVNILILRLYGATKEKPRFNPSVVLPFIKNCLKEKWLLTIDGTLYPFSAKLYKYNRFIQDGKSVQRSLTGTRRTLPKLYETISSGPAKISMVTIATQTKVILSKLHFCEQVRLNMSEVEAGYDEIRILSHGLVLGSNRYVTYTLLNENLIDVGVYTPMVNLTTFAVCLEDFNKKAWEERQQKQNNFKKSPKTHS